MKNLETCDSKVRSSIGVASTADFYIRTKKRINNSKRAIKIAKERYQAP